MASISRIVAALYAGSQETSLALANINFDFALVKIEAPVEFHKLGAALSPSRRAAAETGSYHITARKLGALFEHLLPPTPKLFQCYGLRASKISGNPLFELSASRNKGMFAEHVGIDGTSIWAAATSGKGAIAVHLLACMLARMWKGPEATSIWAELIEERKKQLSQVDPSEPLHFSTLAAAQITLSRDQLAEWDNSARAWIMAADKVESLRQKQLMLILHNLSISVTGDEGGTYKSVMSAWQASLLLMEKILSGVPQSVQDGQLLLALSSWHLYPDLHVLGNRNIAQRDDLVPRGGVVSVGLERSPSKHGKGVYWSLPLAHYRYYGQPEVIKRSICRDSERVTIQEFLGVTLGSFLSGWEQDASGGTKRNAEFVLDVWSYLCARAPILIKASSWLKLLADAASLLINTEGINGEMYSKLVGLGKRRGRNLLGEPPALFGLTYVPNFIHVLNSREAQIAALRRLASKISSRLQIEGTEMFIGYRYRRSTTCNDERDDGWCQFEEYAYATALPLLRPSVKRDRSGCLSSAQYHQRWAFPGTAESKYEARRHLQTIQGESIVDLESGRNRAHLVLGDKDCALYANDDVAKTYGLHENQEHATVDDIRWAFTSEVICWKKLLAFSAGTTEYDAVRSVWQKPTPLSPLHDFHSSMRALVTIAEKYSELPNSMISLRITSRKLSSLHWAQAGLANENDNTESDDGTTESGEKQDAKVEQTLHHLGPLSLTRAETFALLITLETGELNPVPEDFGNVMAMSCGDSIFMAAPLLMDPVDSRKAHPSALQRIQGSIGRAGIAMLVSPNQTLMRQAESADWKLINHNRFDGTLEDHFDGTSLHLSFTDFKMPINIGVYGARDVELYFLEAIVSVHDRGKWIADLDAISALEDWIFYTQDEKSRAPCTHDPASSLSITATAVDNWDEFLDKPTAVFIVRAKSNWIARLSAATMSIQRNDMAVIIDDKSDLCWECIRAEYNINGLETSLALIC